MKNIIKSICFILYVVVAITFVGCRLGNNKGNSGNNESVYTDVYSVYVVADDVYAAGSICQGTSETDVPTLWKNGIAQSVGEMGNFNKASSVFVANNNVYVTVTEDHDKAILWENGQRNVLWNGNANCVFVDEGNVYVAGSWNGASVLWKDGNMQVLAYSGSAESVVVHNNTVYVAGYIGDAFGGEVALWVDGEMYNLGRGQARSVFVTDGGDVFIAGNVNMNTAALWKNGELWWTENSYTSHAYSMTITNDAKIVVSGDAWVPSSGWVAAIWVDGIFSKVDDKMRNQAMSVVSDGDCLYIGGNGNGRLWSVWQCDGKNIYNADKFKRVKTD